MNDKQKELFSEEIKKELKSIEKIRGQISMTKHQLGCEEKNLADAEFRLKGIIEGFSPTEIDKIKEEVFKEFK